MQTVNGTVNTVDQQESDLGLEAGGRIIRDRLFFFGAINPVVAEPDLHRTGRYRELPAARRWAKSIAIASTLSYSAKGTYQPANAHRVDVSFFGDPSKGDMGPQRTSSLTVQDTSSFSELTFGGHNQTVRYDGVVGTEAAGRGVVRARLQQDRRDAVGRYVARDRSDRSRADHHRRHRRL